MHTYIHTYIHIYIRTYIHTYIHTAHTHIHRQVCTESIRSLAAFYFMISSNQWTLNFIFNSIECAHVRKAESVRHLFRTCASSLADFSRSGGYQFTRYLLHRFSFFWLHVEEFHGAHAQNGKRFSRDVL